MAGYAINKGVGKPVEFKGLRAQYFIYAVLGAVISVVLFFLLSFIVGQLAAALCALICFMVSIGVCYYLNNRFGEHGLVQFYARRATPSRVAAKRRIYKIISVRNGD